jgi:hypothetical protein
MSTQLLEERLAALEARPDPAGVLGELSGRVHSLEGRAVDDQVAPNTMALNAAGEVEQDIELPPGLGGTIDLRQLVEGVKQEAEIAKALNAAIKQMPPGSVIYFPPLANPPLLSGSAEVPSRHATIYLLEEALQATTELTFKGPGMMNGRVLLRAKPGFSDSQMVRNWQSTDWQAGRTDAGCGVTNNSAVVTDVHCTEADVGKVVRDARASTHAGLGYVFGVQRGTTIESVVPGVSFTMSKPYVGSTGNISCMVGEPDHWIAPLKTAIYVLYMRVEGLGFDPFGAKGVTCIGRVHPQEQALLRDVVYRSYNTEEGSENVGRMDSANQDAEGGQISGVQDMGPEVSYGKGWTSMIIQDGSCGGKFNPIYTSGANTTRDVTTPVSATSAENRFSSSPLKFIGMSHLRLGPIHEEAQPPTNGPTTAFSDATMTGTALLKTAGSIIFTGHLCGRAITDSEAKIPAGTVIARYISKTEVELSNVATLAAGDVLTIGPDDAAIRILDCSGVVIEDPLIQPHYAVKRPWVRFTSSERNPEREPMSPPLIRGGKLVINRELEHGWEAGSAIIEDYSDDEILRRLCATSEAFDPRTVYDYNGEEITWWDGQTASLRQARLKPRVVPLGELWTPARQGLLAANGDPATLPNSVVPTAGVILLSWIPMPWQLTISKLWYYLLENTGNTFTANENFLGLYSATGALITKTKDLSANWGAAGNNDQNVEHALWHNIGAPPQYNGSGAWLAALVNGTIVKMKFSTVSTAGFPNLLVPGGKEHYRCGTYGEGLAELPASIIPANIASIAQLAWGGIS